MKLELNTEYTTPAGSRLLCVDFDPTIEVRPYRLLVVDLASDAEGYANIGDILRFDESGKGFVYHDKNSDDPMAFVYPFDLVGSEQAVTEPETTSSEPSAPVDVPAEQTTSLPKRTMTQALLVAITAALNLVERLLPLLTDAVSKGQVTIAQQQQIRDKYESLKNRASGEFAAPHWQIQQ